MDTYLNDLARKLNSNEKFSTDDSFTANFITIRMPELGRGHGKKYRFGREAVEKLITRKRCVVAFKN